MAATIFNFNKYLILILFLTLIIKGSCQCTLNDIHVVALGTGRKIQGKSEWNVTVTNGCYCDQSQIKFPCKGFKTTESIDFSKLSRVGDDCLLNNGGSLGPILQSVKFSYAWDPPFIFMPTSSVIGPCL